MDLTLPFIGDLVDGPSFLRLLSRKVPGREFLGHWDQYLPQAVQDPMQDKDHVDDNVE